MIHEDMKNKLREFILYLEQNSLDEYKLGFNIFSVLGIERKERIHSNVLAYFLNPNENHNIGDKYLKRFIQYISYKKNNADILDNFNIDYNKFEIYKEKPENIDIFLLNENDKYIIVIENKIDSDVHSSTGYDSQLIKYKDYIDAKYNDSYTKIFLLLTPDARDPNEDGWNALSYDDIRAIFESILKDEINDTVRTFIDYYINLLKKRIITNDETKNLCQEIYNKYKEAIDFIIENKDDEQKIMGDSFKALYSDMQAKNPNLIFDKKTQASKYIFFRTEQLKKYFKGIAEIEYGFYVDTRDNYLYFSYTENAQKDAENYLNDLNNLFPIGKINKNYTRIVKLEEDNLLKDLEDKINKLLERE